jgi:DNA-binding transcriptional LysR family regulator
MPEIDWNLIRSFAAVAEWGSLSAAARKLRASQPTLGRHITELERALDVTLFRRSRDGYTLTKQGMELLGRAQAMREQAEALSRLALGATEEVAGTVRIAASEMVSIYVLPPLLAVLAVEEPDIEIEIVASNLVENLLGRDADIAIRMMEPSQLDLIARKVADIPIVACAATSYLDRRGRPEDPSQLLQHVIIGFDRGMEMINGFRDAGVEIDRHAFHFRCDNHAVIWEATRAGIGISFQQRPIVEREPLVEIILPELRTPVLPCWIAMHRDLRSSVRIRRVADFLREALRCYCEGRPLSAPASNSAARASPAIRHTTTKRTETAT